MSTELMSMEVDLNMSSVVVDVPVVVGPKSNKRRINFLTSKVAELQSELLELEALEEEYEAFRSSKVTKRTKGRPQAKKAVEEEVDLFANLVKEVVSSAEGANEIGANEIGATVSRATDVSATVSRATDVSGENNNNNGSEIEASVTPVTLKPAPAKKEKASKEKKEKPVKHVLTEDY